MLSPDRPRLFERSLVGGPVEPDFALLRYQFGDAANGEKLLEGGLMQFALTLGLPAEAIPQTEEGDRRHEDVEPPTRFDSPLCLSRPRR